MLIRKYIRNGNQPKQVDTPISLDDAVKAIVENIEYSDLLDLLTYNTIYIVVENQDEAINLVSAVVKELTIVSKIILAAIPDKFFVRGDYKEYLNTIIINPRIKTESGNDSLFNIIDNVYSLNYRIWTK